MLRILASARVEANKGMGRRIDSNESFSLGGSNMFVISLLFRVMQFRKSLKEMIQDLYDELD